jgi:SulP family sulfate permease
MVDRIAKLFSQAVVRGIQLTLGLIFLKKGIQLIISPNIFLTGTHGGEPTGYPINLIIGIAVFVMILMLLDNKRIPAAFTALVAGIVLGVILGGLKGQKISLGPAPIHLILPSAKDFWTATIMLILPQVPLTIGNSCVGTEDTCTSLFAKDPNLSKAKAGKFALTMGLVNLPAGFFGAVPMCHGTGGLAAHYRFGARSGGAPVMIGLFFVVVALVLGELGFALLTLIPQAILGVLLVFAGLELCPLMRSLKTNEEYFVALLIAGIAMVIPNMAWAFGIGILVDMFIRTTKIKI